jgi:sugar O-acyltransferase (sialic acid O-acetyltransferase NeuD family)
MKVVIVGAGGHGQVVADIYGATSGGSTVELLGYVDDVLDRGADRRILGPVSALGLIPHDAVTVAIGNNALRSDLTARLVAETFLSAVHARAVLSADVVVGDGSMICAGVVVNTGSRIGRSVILNTGCTIDHHSSIGDFVHIAPGVHMGGEVRVEEGAFLGIGAAVLPRIRIGAWSTVGAGAVVIRDVPAGVTVVGNPARQIAKNDGNPATPR